MAKDFRIASGEEIKRRAERAEEFFAAVLDPDECPLIVTDEATLYDLFVGDESQVISRCERHYAARSSRV